MKIISRGGILEFDLPTRIVKIDRPEKPESDRRTRVVVRVWLGDDFYDCNCRIEKSALESLGVLHEFAEPNVIKKYTRRVTVSSAEAASEMTVPSAIGVSEIRLESIDGMVIFDAPVE